jgi:hypothetical protein
MDFIDFDVEKNKKNINRLKKNEMASEFKMAAKTYFWRLFFLTFSQYCGVFVEKLFFLIQNELYREIEMTFLSF